MQITREMGMMRKLLFVITANSERSGIKRRSQTKYFDILEDKKKTCNVRRTGYLENLRSYS